VQTHDELLAYLPAGCADHDVGGIGEQPDYPGDAHQHAGLLDRLPHRRIEHTLAHVDATTRQLPRTAVPPLDQQQAAPIIPGRDEYRRHHTVAAGALPS
jgi:hypothetical protein